ncbi:MAG: 30S ribosomal protein S3 [Planctomycetota bacterium]|jgi:small subunit ribosomal protein S3
MGQKVNPIGFRVGITRKSDSRWYADKINFGKYLVEDYNIRKHIKGNFGFAGLPKIEIERTEDDIEITLHAARPGVVIGRHGAEVDRLRGFLEQMTEKKVNIKIQEISKPELDGQLVAEQIAEALTKRVGSKRVMKKAAESCIQAGAIGIKMLVSGRINGAEIARSDDLRIGSVPCQKLSADISYGFAEANTTMGIIGVKVWIYRGDIDEMEGSNGPDA